MKRSILAITTMAAMLWLASSLGAGAATRYPFAALSVFTVSPWAYACGHTAFGNPATQQDLPGEGACPTSDTLGNANAAYTAGVLTLSKTGPTSDDLAAGATIGGLTSLTAASFDLVGESYCGAGAPRLNVVTADKKVHFFGCAANNKSGHVAFDLSAAGDGAGNGGVGPDDVVTAIDIVQDEQGTATLNNLTFVGKLAPTPTPTPTATPTPSPSATQTATATPTPTATAHPPVVLPQTGGGGGSIPWQAIVVTLMGGLLLSAGIWKIERDIRR